MLQIIGYSLLFFSPVIESFSRIAGYNLLLIGSLFVSFPIIRERKLCLDGVEKLFLVLLIIFSISTLNSWSPTLSYLELLRYIAYFGIFLSVRRINNGHNFINRFVIPMIIVNSIILSIIFLFYLIPIVKIVPPNLSTGPFYGMNLFYPNFGHNHLSDLFIFALPLVYGISALGSLFFTVVFILTSGRGAMLSLLLAFFISVFFLKHKLQKKWYRILFFLTLLALTFTAVSFIVSNIYFPYRLSFLNQTRVIKPAANDKRIGYLLQAVKGFSLSPILGTGLDTFRMVSYRYPLFVNGSTWWSWYTHNHFLQLLAETGLLGGMSFLLLILVLLKKSIKSAGSSGLFVGFLASLIHSLFDFDWQFLSVFLIFWIYSALLVPIVNPKIGQRPNILVTIFYIVIIVLFVWGIYMANTIIWV